ncbi:MAG TPA: hypothetical protein VFH58_10520 [Acidimicrobiales bacterium]|nr:hypothetical protein [Acidimicrobiales bacterium]
MTTLASNEPTASPTRALAESIRRLGRPSTAFSRDRLMLYVGGALLPLGILVVALGWLGASHTVLLFEQIPYLISGGQIGQSLVFAGGFIYFAYWQTLLVRESRARHAEMMEALNRLQGGVPGGAAPTAIPTAIPAEGAPPAVGAPSSVASELVATPSGSMFHRPECRVVTGREGLRPVGDPRGMVPCRLCRPAFATS